MLQFFDSTAVSCDSGVVVYGRAVQQELLGIEQMRVECATTGTSVPHTLVRSEERPDFALLLPRAAPGIVHWLDHMRQPHTHPINPVLAFEDPALPLNRATAEQRGAVSTMTLGDADRIEEWVNYHAQLGITDTLLFLNSTQTFEKVLPGVSVIPFPYFASEGEHWNEIQRAALNIGAAALRRHVEFIAFIDVDEFIGVSHGRRLPELMRRGSIQVHGDVLTNKDAAAPVCDNVLQLAVWRCQDASPKIVVNTADLDEVPFVSSPHGYMSKQTPLPQAEAKLFHIWLNERCPHNSSMSYLRLDKETHWEAASRNAASTMWIWILVTALALCLVATYKAWR